MKKIIMETACLVNGQHQDIGSEVETDIETADILIRHRRASDPAAEAEAPADPEPAPTPAPASPKK